MLQPALFPMTETPLVLSATEVRVLGALVEKSITTPEYYPLSLNALTNACNQLTNREPVMTLDEADVTRALEALRVHRLASVYHGSESRVAKYKHSLTDAILLTPAEVALLCVLMLRGPQTVGELRARSERLFAFDSLPEIEETLNVLAARAPDPLVTKLPRQPGTKESRYAHLLSGPIEAGGSAREIPSVAPSANSTPPPAPAQSDARVAQLEAELAALRREVATLQEQFAQFKKQFE
jgi:uncharacterized protein YceH (UPF0502 family)